MFTLMRRRTLARSAWRWLAGPAWAVLLVTGVARGQLLSTFVNQSLLPLAGNEPMPDNLFDASDPNPFSRLTTNGQPTLMTVWTQTVAVQRGPNVAVGQFQAPQFLDVTESASIGHFYEFAEQMFETSGTTDPILNSQLILGQSLPGTMRLQIVDANPNVAGIQAYTNDLAPRVPAPNGTPIAVWTGPAAEIRIVSPQGQTIATNTMTPFAFAALPPGDGTLDNAFGILGPTWTVRTDNVDGDSSPWLDAWRDLVQGRWKPHPNGWAFVVTGTVTGPAGLIHTAGGGRRACCLRDGTCIDTVRTFCLARGGMVQPPGSTCLTTICLPGGLGLSCGVGLCAPGLGAALPVTLMGLGAMRYAGRRRGRRASGGRET